MERKVYCDYLRIIAIFAMIMLHVSSQKWSMVDVNGVEWKIFNFYNSIVRWCVPVFVMISGSLFLGRDVPIKTIYAKYIMRMITAFIFWSFFYALVHAETFKEGIIYEIKKHYRDIILGHYHMWFILMIIGLYMCIPLIKRIISDETTMKYFLIISFVFAFLIPWGERVLNDFVGYKYEIVQRVLDLFNTNVMTMSMNMIMGYSFYFVLGYYLDRIAMSKNVRGVIYCLGILGCAFTVIVDLILTVRTQQACGNYYGNFSVNVLCEALAIHTLFKSSNFKNKRMASLLREISKYGFGAYLVHAFFIEKLSSVFGVNSLTFDARISVPIISILVFTLSICVSAILNKIPILKKYVV